MRRFGRLMLGVACFVLLAACAAAGARSMLTGPATIASGPGSGDSYHDAVLADSPRAYWRLGEASGTVAADETGTNPGTYLLGVALGAAGGIRNSTNTAAQFDGSNDNVQVPDSPSLDLSTGVTVEVLVKRSKNAASQAVIGKPANGQSKFENYSIWINSANKPIAYFGNGTTYTFVTAANAIDTGWHHIVATYDNTMARIYVDGVLSASKTSNLQLTPNTNPLNIGRSISSAFAFGGVLDEAAVYGTVLSATRIRAHFDAARLDTDAPTVTLSAPAAGSLTNDATPTTSGTAGNAGGDLGNVTAKIYAGTSATGTPVRTMTTTRSGTAWSVDTSPALGDGTYTAQAEQSDDSGNIGRSEANTFAVDTTAPIPSIDSAPSSPTNNPNASLSFSANEPSTFLCRVDGAAFQPCTSPTLFFGLADGSHTFDVKATDRAGNTSAPVSASWTVDTVAPTASITGHPADPTASTDASFTFSSSEPGSTFACAIDGASLTSCSSPSAYSGLADGSHSFRVVASDAAGNPSTAATFDWRVDLVAPVVTLDTPPNGSATNDPTPTLSGTAGTSPGDDTTVTVKVYAGSDATGTPVRTLPVTRTGDFYAIDTYAPLDAGVYTAQAEQGDSVGNVGQSATTTFEIDLGGPDTTPPHLTLTAPVDGSETNDQTPTLTGMAGINPGDLSDVTIRIYAGTEASGPEVQVVNTIADPDGAYSASPSTDLAEGTYTAQAEQRDSSGNVGHSRATTFVVDVTPPQAIVTAGPNDPTNSTAASFQFSSSESGSTSRCAMDSGAYADCSSPKQYSGLAEGNHTFHVKAIDRAGNLSSAADYAWRIDVTAPVASITNAPPTLTQSHAAAFSFTASEAGSAFHCSLDGAAYEDCDSPRSYAGLADGAHTFDVKASDVAGNLGAAASFAWTVDDTDPAVTLTTPANGGSTALEKPIFSGTAGTATGDQANVTIKLYSGSSASGTPIQTLTTTRGAGGAYSAPASARLLQGTYTAQTQQDDQAGNTGTSSANTFTVTDPVILAAGDIAGCEDGSGEQRTAAILDANPEATVAPLGDTAYINGTASEFANCYDPSWGRAKQRSRPTVGDHEYGTPNASGYFNYFQDQLLPFGPQADDSTKGMYSYDLGTWHVVVLNSNCTVVGGCTAGSPMEQWLRADLAAHSNMCQLAYWHHPRWSSGGEHGSDSRITPFWQALYDYGVEVVLNGNEHLYERFAPQTPTGQLDTAQGVRQFTVGTGGYFFYPFATILPNSEARNTGTYGVLKLVLKANGYDWEFLHEAGGTYTDSGTGTCHGTPPPPPPPPPPPQSAPQVRAVTSNAVNGATSITINTPAGTTAGDVLLAVLTHQNGVNRNLTAPAGWTAVPNTDFTDGTNARVRAFYKVAGPSEPASYTFTLLGGSGQDTAGGVMAIAGASTTSPINASNGQSNAPAGSSRNVTAPSITTTLADSLLVFGGACNVAATFTPPTGMTEQWDRATSGTYKVAIEAATEYPPAGPTGTRVATASTSCRSLGVSIAIAPAAAG